MHVFEVAWEGRAAFWGCGWPRLHLAPREWTGMATLRADLVLRPSALSTSSLRLFLVARHSSSGDVLSSRDRCGFPFQIARASQIDREKRSAHQEHFAGMCLEGRGLTFSSRHPLFLSTFCLQPFRSLTTHQPSRAPQFHGSFFS